MNLRERFCSMCKRFVIARRVGNRVKLCSMCRGWRRALWGMFCSMCKRFVIARCKGNWVKVCSMCGLWGRNSHPFSASEG